MTKIDNLINKAKQDRFNILCTQLKEFWPKFDPDNFKYEDLQLELGNTDLKVSIEDLVFRYYGGECLFLVQYKDYKSRSTVQVFTFNEAISFLSMQ